MPDDPLDTNVPPLPPPASTRQKIICEFCDCQVTPRGEVIVIGEKAKKFRKHEEIVEGKDAEIARLNAEISALKQERDALRGAPSTGSAGHRAGSRVS